jgi:hypothetical protein
MKGMQEESLEDAVECFFEWLKSGQFLAKCAEEEESG